VSKPKTLLGQRLNQTASDALVDVDVVVVVLDATAAVGTGDQFVLDRAPRDAVIALTKVDKAPRRQVLDQLRAAASRGGADREYFPVSGQTGEGVDALVDHLVARLPEGPPFYPDDVIADVDDETWVAELVREQLLAVTRDEVPYSVACRVTEWEWPHIRCEIIVERDSQKGIVIGRGGAVLKEVGTRVREQLPEGAFVELVVKVVKDWQQHPASLNRLGY
jgi:GTP-binding protein Era